MHVELTPFLEKNTSLFMKVSVVVGLLLPAQQLHPLYWLHACMHQGLATDHEVWHVCELSTDPAATCRPVLLATVCAGLLS
jgi:hypothetical protein